jgi:hypothetical protein
MSCNTDNNDESQLYRELKGFLASDRLDVQRAAAEAILQVTDDHGMSQLLQHGLIEKSSQHVSHSDAILSITSLQGLLQVSSAEGSPVANANASECVDVLLSTGILDRLMEILLTTATKDDDADNNEQWRQKVNLAMALLANLTRTEEGSIALCGRMLPEEAVATTAASTVQLPPKPTLELLLARFLNSRYLQPNVDYRDMLFHQPACALEIHGNDPFQHFAAVLMNASQTPQGRSFLLKLHYSPDPSQKAVPPTSVLQRLLPELRSPNPIRRRGMAGMLRNCCTDQDSAFWFLTQLRLVDHHILMLLAGPEELDLEEKQGLHPDLWLKGPDQEREPDHLTRLFLVQAILMLCQTGRQSRLELNRIRTSVILKYADMVEEHDDVSDVISECLLYLKRDEVDTGGGGGDATAGFSIEEVDDENENEDPSLTAVATQRIGGLAPASQVDFDNVD